MKLYHDRLNETWLCEQTEQYFTTHISLPESFRHFSFEIKISRSWKKNSSYKPALRVFIYFSFSWELRATSIESQESEESYVAFLGHASRYCLTIDSFIHFFVWFIRFFKCFFSFQISKTFKCKPVTIWFIVACQFLARVIFKMNCSMRQCSSTSPRFFALTSMKNLTNFT